MDTDLRSRDLQLTRYLRLTEMIEDEARTLLADERANIPPGAELWFATADTVMSGELKIVAFWRDGDVSGNVHRMTSGEVKHYTDPVQPAVPL